MTKGEYCNKRGLHVSFPNFNPSDKLTAEFKDVVDALIDNFEDVCSENNVCENVQEPN